MTILTQSQFAIAFTHTRSEAGAQRDSLGQLITAAVDAPRFDHSAAGDARGLLVTAGSDLGVQDRLAFDELMLPEQLVEGDDLRLREATVYHCFRRLGTLDAALALDQPGFEAGIERRAWYSRDAARTIERLMNAEGHHLSIGVHAGFAPNRDGFARYRGQLWRLPDLIETGSGVIAAEDGRPLITSGAERVP